MLCTFITRVWPKAVFVVRSRPYATLPCTSGQAPVATVVQLGLERVGKVPVASVSRPFLVSADRFGVSVVDRYRPRHSARTSRIACATASGRRNGSVTCPASSTMRFSPRGTEAANSL